MGVDERKLPSRCPIDLFNIIIVVVSYEDDV